MSPQYISARQASEEIDRLTLLNAELVEALEAVLDTFGVLDTSDDDEDWDSVEKARTALAKARKEA